MTTEWKYLWSIVRGARQGNIYIHREQETQLRGDEIFKVVLLEDGVKVPTKETNEYVELEYCRILAEEFVEGGSL
jgi:hypothetical protein